MSYVKALFLNEASNNASTRKKSRAKQVNINELLKFYSQAPQTTSPNYLTANASPSKAIPEFTPNSRHRVCNKEITSEKRAVSSNGDGTKRDRSKVTFALNTNDINRALSQVLLDFKEFKTDQQQNSSEEKRQRFKSNTTNFSDLSDKNAQFVNKVHLNINEYDDTSNEFKFKASKFKPPIHDRSSRGILKELNLGKRAVSSNEHVKHATNESGHFPSPILKSSNQLIRSQNDTVKPKRVKSLTFKEVDPGEKCAISTNLRDRQDIVKLKPNTSVTINLPIKVRSKESDKPKANTFIPKMETHRSSSFTNSKNLSKIYSNLIDKIDKDLLKKEETPVARVSLKDSSKKSSNIKPQRSQSSYDYLLSAKNQTLPRVNSFHRQPSRDKSLCDSVKNFKSDIADLFNTHDSNANDEGVFSYAQTSEYVSQSEKKIIDSLEPIETAEKSELEVFGQRGIWLNKSEQSEWKGDRALSDYPLNLDLNPTVIRKKPLNNQIEYIQSLAIRYLKPPTPHLPGDIVIIQEPDSFPNPAPPIIIRQEPNKPETPEPLIIREAPPKPPDVCKKTIKISLRGKQLSPPPRKVILEKLPELPSRPCPILVERWLPYSQVKRKVIFQPASPVQNYDDTKNVIINWSQPSVSIRKEFKYLGVSKANPDEYVKNFGATLKEPNELASFVPDYKNFDTAESLCESTGLYEITSSANTLNQIKTKSKDLKSKQVGLNKVKIASEVEHLGFSCEKNSVAVDCIEKHTDSSENLEIAAAKVIQASQTFSSCNSSTAVKLAFNSASFIALNDIISQIFEKVDHENNGFISLEEATQIFIRLNYHLNRKIEESDIHEHFDLFTMKDRNLVNLDEFKTIFFKLSA